MQDSERDTETDTQLRRSQNAKADNSRRSMPGTTRPGLSPGGPRSPLLLRLLLLASAAHTVSTPPPSRPPRHGPKRPARGPLSRPGSYAEQPISPPSTMLPFTLRESPSSPGAKTCELCVSSVLAFTHPFLQLTFQEAVLRLPQQCRVLDICPLVLSNPARFLLRPWSLELYKQGDQGSERGRERLNVRRESEPHCSGWLAP